MTQFLLRRRLAVVATAFFPLVCVGLLAGPVCAAEKEEEKVVEKKAPDIWDVREEGRFFGVKKSTGEGGCTPMTALVMVDITGGTFVGDAFSTDPACLKVGGTDPTTDEGIPGRTTPRKSHPRGGRKLSTFSVIGRFP